MELNNLPLYGIRRPAGPWIMAPIGGDSIALFCSREQAEEMADDLCDERLQVVEIAAWDDLLAALREMLTSEAEWSAAKIAVIGQDGENVIVYRIAEILAG